MPPNMCRCCGLPVTSHKELFTEYYEGDVMIVYSDLLQNIFNISMSHQKKNDICQDCVKKLTEAMEFKHLVLKTEDRLIETINFMETDSEIKTENYFDEGACADGWHFDDTQDNISKVITINSNNELYMKDTSFKLIKHSNMCLFVSQRTKFKCFYCIASFNNMTKLREHSSIHNSETLINVFKNLSQISTRNVDISNLKCECGEPCKTLEDLRTHLSTTHAVKFDSDEHLLVPFSLTLTDEYNCAMCSEKYNTFHSLNIHMNSHSKTNVCEVCGISFWSRFKLRIHIYSQHKKKKCNLCSETFKTASLRTKHMRKVHLKGISRRFCPECGLIFKYDHQLTEHRIKTHDLKRKIYKCTECTKDFKLACNLYKHIRGVHRGEKRFSCELCSMSFSSKSDRTRHERIHDNEKQFSCDYCNCKFKRKDSWRRHIKKQHANVKDLEIKL